MNDRLPNWRTLLMAGLCAIPLLAVQSPAQGPNAPAAETEDLSEAPRRTLGAKIHFPRPDWNEADQRVVGPAVVIEFQGTAAPLDQVGETLPEGAVRIAPEVAGSWKWQRATRLEFFPTAHWLPPGHYRFGLPPGTLAEDAVLEAGTDLGRWLATPTLSARFHDRDYYIDPATPALQQLVTSVDFSQPVSLDELRRHFSVTSVTDREIFQAGSEPELVPDAKNPLRFHLRSPLMKPGDKEDLVRFRIERGLQASAGGRATTRHLETKLTAYSRTSQFFVESLGATLRRTPDGEPEQAILVGLSIPARGAEVADAVEAWMLPPETRRDSSGRMVAWNRENVSDEVLEEAEKLELEWIRSPAAPPLEAALAFRVARQPGGKIFLRVPAELEGPGGFVTPEAFRGVTVLPAIPKEAALMGRGGLLALQGERQINVRSRGIDHLRYTVGRVRTERINHLVSQARGSFSSPRFLGGFGFADISDYEQSVQAIVRDDEYSLNYSSFDFSPLIRSALPDAKARHGLFHLSVEGVRPRTAADGEAAEGSADADWVSLPAARSWNHHEPAGSHYPVGDRPRDSRFLLVTDLGLIVKEAADGSRTVFVHSFADRGPVADVKITVLSRNGTELRHATTDGIGRAELPSLRGLQRELAPVALLAAKGDDLAFIPWANHEQRLNLSRFAVGGERYSEKSALRASLFTERDIYRPGEAIHVGGIVRPRDWSAELAGLPVELVVTDAKEEVAARYPLQLETGGVFSQRIPTAETSPTGPWRIHLEHPAPEDAQARRPPPHLGATIVRVEEFQPDRLKIQAGFAPAGELGWRSPEGLAVAVQLDTLFGTPAAGRRIAAELQLSPTTPSFPAWPGWHFGVRPPGRFDSRELPVGDGLTDADGRAVLPLHLDAHTAPMLWARVKLQGFEADGGRGVRTELGTLVSRQAWLLGYRTDRNLDYLEADQPAAVEIVAIGPDAEPLAVAGLTRVLIRQQHASVLTRQRNGSLAYESQEREETIASEPVSLAAGKTSLPLPVETPGRFRYEFRNAAGQTLCAIPFFVAGRGDATKDLERSGELEIRLAEKEWRPGEELEFSLTTPFTGAGLITVERDAVLAQQWFRCDRKSSVQKIHLPDDIEGGAYLHVVMARALDSPDVFLNPLASGVIPIPAARGPREMAVTLDCVERVRPGERLAIGYSAPQEGRIALWAVDEGIHLLSNYQAPDPLARLLPKAALEVQTFQLLDQLMPESSLYRKALAIGGDGAARSAVPTLQTGLNPFKRRRDAPVIYWSGFVPCGPERREVFYQVPESFSGRLKIHAVAVTPGSIGVAEAETISKGDFVLTATAPLFVVPGDEFTASLTVANQLEGESATERVSVAVESLGGVEILAAPAAEQIIAVGDERTLGVRCRATEQLGNAELVFTAAGGGGRQVAGSTLSVRPGVARAAKVRSGWFRNGSHDVDLDHPLFREFAERRAIVSTTPLGLAHGLTAYLQAFPHGCTEQITSRAFPWLVLKEDARFGIERQEAGRLLTETMNQLSLRQGRNGGFGYWAADEPEGFDYLTVYVGHFLTECHASGFPVPARLHQATLRRLRHMADAQLTPPRKVRGRMDYRQTLREAGLRAAAIYLLTRNEEVTTNYALKLQDYLEAKVPEERWHRESAAAWLAASWRLLKKESAAAPLIAAHRAALAKPLAETHPASAHYDDSRLTREATVFTVLCRHFPEIAGDFSYADLEPLTGMIEQADYHTLSAAWSVLALKAYADLTASRGVRAGIARLRDGNVEILADAAEGQVQVELPPGPVRFFLAEDSPQGMGAWFQTIEQGFARELPGQAESMHLEVRRELLDPAGEPVTRARLGETLTARLTLRNLTRTRLPYLAITELLPGGFEFAPPGEPDSLRPGLATRQGVDYLDLREDRALFYLGLPAEGSLTLQYALRPTCAGTFVLPPPYAEDMYDAKVRAHGAAGRLTVLPRP